VRLSANTVRYCRQILPVILLLANCALLEGNDSAAELAAGGIQLRKENRVSMEKERLTISLQKVTVEYEFLNTSQEDVTTEVAFPVPPYAFTPEYAGGIRDFTDFRVWVNGQEVKYKTDVRAKLKGSDYTDLLRSLGIDIQTFAQFPTSDYDVSKSQIGKLPEPKQERLSHLGLTRDDGFPMWMVVKTYHWSQEFPARKAVRIRHEYTPGVGFRPQQIATVRTDLGDVCIDATLQQRLSAVVARLREHASKEHVQLAELVEAQWVKYILTTANTWKTPIKNFELVVDKSAELANSRFLGVGMCWAGNLQRVDGQRLVAKKRNFIPSEDLTVYYFYDFGE